MKLSAIELDRFDTQGFLVLPELFTLGEVERLRTRLSTLFTESHPGHVIEQFSGEVRTAMGLHLRDEVFAKLVRHPRLLGPAQQVRPEPLYVQQVNVKAAFSGEGWQWHDDFSTHREEDGVVRPLALNLHVFPDDVTEFNGPIYSIPEPHRAGARRASLDDQSTSYPLWVLDKPIVQALANTRGMGSATGARSTGLIFFDTLVHASPNKISPWDRAIFSLIVNPVSNALRRPTRPDHKHHRELTPVTPLPEDCLSVERAA